MIRLARASSIGPPRPDGVDVHVEALTQLVGVAHVCLDECTGSRHSGTMPGTEIVEHDHLVASSNQSLTRDATDVPGSTRHQDTHPHHPFETLAETPTSSKRR